MTVRASSTSHTHFFEPLLDTASCMHPCPCCKSPTIHEPGGFECCPVCEWGDDGQGDADADVFMGGMNETSLAEARRRYAEDQAGGAGAARAREQAAGAKRIAGLEERVGMLAAALLEKDARLVSLEAELAALVAAAATAAPDSGAGAGAAAAAAAAAAGGVAAAAASTAAGVAPPPAAPSSTAGAAGGAAADGQEDVRVCRCPLCGKHYAARTEEDCIAHVTACMAAGGPGVRSAMAANAAATAAADAESGASAAAAVFAAAEKQQERWAAGDGWSEGNPFA